VSATLGAACLPEGTVSASEASARLHLVTTRASSGRVGAVRVLAYVTNHAVNRIPSHALRTGWYARILGARIGAGSSIHLGTWVLFFGPRQLRRDGLVIGAGTVVNRRCCLDARGGLEIGDDVSVSPEVAILTASHRVNDPAFGLEMKRVVIEDHVWIGTRAMILPGVTLGSGCVVAAGAVVTRDVPALTIVAGVPAAPIGVRREEATHYRVPALRPFLE
jgi:acetyltransferase-like isoleucine patch superfamily enzyme